MPRAAFEAVNGFDETFEGWGWEDLDLGLRLQLAGFRGHNVVAESRALHLFHEPAACSSANREYYQRSRNGEYRCKMGLSQ